MHHSRIQSHIEYLQRKHKYSIGDYVKPYGKIVGIRWDGWERVYMFESQYGTVSLIPALCLPEKE